MSPLEELLEKYSGVPVALYGLGAETGRFLAAHGELPVTGLLDGYRQDGEEFGLPVLTLRQAQEQGVRLIIVVARPGSCKAIARCIGGQCREKGIALWDVRGRDLLAENAVCYDFSRLEGGTRAELWKKIQAADTVSFDLFDTLVCRKVLEYTDLFEIMALRLEEQGVILPHFAQLRLTAEKELSKTGAPALERIYEEVLRMSGGGFVTAEELSEMEWTLDSSQMLPREDMCALFRQAVSLGKRVFITTDSYYGGARLLPMLKQFGLTGFEALLVSCEYGISKTAGLMERLVSAAGTAGGILHIGDDAASDIAPAEGLGLDTFCVYSGADLMEALGWLGLEKDMNDLAGRLKTGLFVSRFLNSSFQFEGQEKTPKVSDGFSIGYLFFGPMLMDYILWLRERVRERGLCQVLFCARDGYLMGRLYRLLDRETKALYFLSSRIAAIRAGVRDKRDISEIERMKYFGTWERAMKTRYGIDASAEMTRAEGIAEILERSEGLAENYRKYIASLGLLKEDTAFFDFVAKGTVQYYLQRIMPQSLKGFYFLRLEPDAMADKGLDIESFFSEEEQEHSAVFDHYYILETVLTSPYPSVEEFDRAGMPHFCPETRSEEDLRCIRQVQRGILSYAGDYLALLPESARLVDKNLDGAMLSLIRKIPLTDPAFLALKVEDPFFGRMTDIRDLLL